MLQYVIYSNSKNNDQLTIPVLDVNFNHYVMFSRVIKNMKFVIYLNNTWNIRLFKTAVIDWDSNEKKWFSMIDPGWILTVSGSDFYQENNIEMTDTSLITDHVNLISFTS